MTVTGIYGNENIYTNNREEIRVKEVVAKNLQLNACTLNEITEEYEYKRVKNCHLVGTIKNNSDLLNIQAEGLGKSDGAKNGIISITVTPTQKVLTKKGLIEAGKLTENDMLISSYSSLVGEAKDFLYAMTAGDAHLLYNNENSKNTAALFLEDSIDPKYLKHKLDKLSPFMTFRKRGRGFVSEFTHDLKVIRDEIYSFTVMDSNFGRNPIPFLDSHFTSLGLAIWIMDDGSFNNGRYTISIARFATYKPLLEIVSYLMNKYGYKNKIFIDTENHNAGIVFNKESSYKIAKTIYQYVPKCMEHKLPEEFWNKYIDFELQCSYVLLPEFIKVTSIKEASNRQMNKLKAVYALEIEGNSNYLVGNHLNGILIKSIN